MNRNTLRTLVTLSVIAAAGTAMAADFPAAYGELPVQAVTQTNATAPRAATPSASATTSGRTRAEVRAELEAAQCRGDLPYDGGQAQIK